MSQDLQQYWKIKLEKCQKALETNNFKAFIADDPQAARDIVLNDIFPGIKANLIGWGDSLTLYATGILDDFETMPDVRLIKTFESGVPRDEIMERRRQALLSDLFFTGTNAVTETGKLVNLDMVGNRTAPIAFGPKHVVLMIGRNKLVPDVQQGMDRIKNLAAPANAIRHHFKTPCAKTGKCHDCKSPQRICNTWTITEKSFPEGRINVILINQDLGL